jgi:3-hydroxyisobutyrate dehydrogenase-like beta-hydroxyacid dehydrogenase
MSKVAFIGLGRMGRGMAGRYLDAGFTVAVWNRSKAKAEDLIARGARWASSPADAADGAEAVVTMVADDDASHAVWLGKDGAAAAMKAAASRSNVRPSRINTRSSWRATCAAEASPISIAPSPACRRRRRPES